MIKRLEVIAVNEGEKTNLERVKIELSLDGEFPQLRGILNPSLSRKNTLRGRVQLVAEAYLSKMFGNKLDHFEPDKESYKHIKVPEDQSKFGAVIRYNVYLKKPK